MTSILWAVTSLIISVAFIVLIPWLTRGIKIEIRTPAPSYVERKSPGTSGKFTVA
jgi:cytochrome bd-type quinol oxidase subunit 2